jgi:uncharacterized protein YvpB
MIALFITTAWHQTAQAKTVHLNVPFTSQAPEGNWNEPWLNACEETSISMVSAYYEGKRTFSTELAKQYIQAALTQKEARFGASLDEGVDIVAEVINQTFPFEARIVEQPTRAQIKQELDAGRPVIVPVDGQALENIYFFGDGPPYHMLVLIGYDDDRKVYITNEPGTSRGASYTYGYTTIESAIFDFTSRATVRSGPKRAIFTRPTTAQTANIDGDGDGLTKMQEQTYHSHPAMRDTDQDGYTDDIEAKSGYSPDLNESALPQGTLIKSRTSPAVFLFSQGYKRPIVSEHAFLSRGWNWDQIVLVSDRFLNRIPAGTSLE